MPRMELDMYELEGFERMMFVLLRFLFALVQEPTSKLSQGATARYETRWGRVVDTVGVSAWVGHALWSAMSHSRSPGQTIISFSHTVRFADTCFDLLAGFQAIAKPLDSIRIVRPQATK